jgi:hypothetical protein
MCAPQVLHDRSDLVLLRFDALGQLELDESAHQIVLWMASFKVDISF